MRKFLFLAIALAALLGPLGVSAADHRDTSVFTTPGQTIKWDYQSDKLNRNRKSEATLFLSDNARPDDLTVVFWFHGCNGYSERTFKTRLDRQFARLRQMNHSYAVVIPELYWSKNTTTRCGRQSKSFRKKNDLVNFVNSSLSKINYLLSKKGKLLIESPRIVFVGHSAGGSVFKATAISGDLCKINPDYVVWSDSTYGNWFNSAWSNCLSKGNSRVVVLIRKWTATWKSFKKFAVRKSPPEFLEIKYYRGKIYHSTIGDNALEFAEVFPEGC